MKPINEYAVLFIVSVIQNEDYWYSYMVIYLVDQNKSRAEVVGYNVT